jgi:hypothetical protein
MKINQSVNFGTTLAGISGSINYQLFDTKGSPCAPPTNTGVYEIGTGTGCYGVEFNLNHQFSGSIIWTSSLHPGVNAIENISMDQKLVRNMTIGRWKILSSTKEMVFYEEDGVTEIIRFSLLDRNSNPSFTEVFERVRE